MSSSSKNPDEIKKIEAESWGSSQKDNDSNPLKKKYYITQNNFLLERSILNLNLDNKSVINVGGGSGFEAEYLIKNGVKSVLVVDIAPGQLKQAEMRKIENNLNNLYVELGDAEKLKHDDKTFDIGYVYMALHHFPNHDISISEICRVSHNIVFVDIMDSGFTKVLNIFGLFKTEWCGIEPNRLNEKEIMSILADQGMKNEIEYFFCPPYYNSKFFNFLKKIVNLTIRFQIISKFFGNIAIIKGKSLNKK